MAWIFFSVVPCESVHFKGEGYAVTVDITSHFQSKLQQWPINLSAAICMKRRKEKKRCICLIMQSINYAWSNYIQQPWGEDENAFLWRALPAPFTGPVIRPGGWVAFPSACLLVYWSAYSGKEILFFLSLSAAQIFVLWLNLQRFRSELRRVQETGCIDNKRSKVKAQPGGGWGSTGQWCQKKPNEK